MNSLANVFRFGWPYLRRYWSRLLAGVLLGVLFGVTNASFPWFATTLLERLKPKPPATQAAQEAKPFASEKAGAGAEKLPFSESRSRLKQLGARLEGDARAWLDPWLPEAGRAFDWRQAVGVLLLPLLVAARGFIGYLSSYCMIWVAERCINDLRCDVLAKLNTLSLDFFNRAKMGDLLTRINSDTTALYRALNLGFSDLIKEPMTILAMLAYLCYVDWKLTLFTLAFLSLTLIPVQVLGKKVRRATQAAVNATVSQSSLLVEVLSGIRVVKAFCLEAEQERRFREYSRQLVHHGVKNVQAKELVNPFVETLSMIGLAVVVIYVFRFTAMDMADVVGFVMGLALLYPSVKKLAGVVVLFDQSSVGVNRLVQVLSEQPSVKEPASPRLLKGFSDALALNHLSFSYGNPLVLKEINLRIPRGFKLGVAGESDSGKSTLVNLLFRFYDPTSGAVKLDGLDLREVSTRDLRQVMALVSQEIVLFDQSVAENIALGRPGATRAEIEVAARAADAHDFIMQLPQGYDTRVGERGVTLSGGQRQRIAIARAFIRNAPILVLDEATAALDSASEAEVQAAIDRLEENRTVICVAHRLSTLAAMDRIVVLQDGAIIEQGTFQELLRAGGVFADMARRQGHVVPAGA
ncbi:MAG: ABC transporter ATP-binding protein [Verrucomicrobia bacterium]|nr:ABC transporter ATP-binding protein [Verrucomicrobiota bacterium]